MILNISRAKFFQSCRQYSYNWHELGLMSHREADPLVIGGGYHIGSEVITRTGDVEEAVKAAETNIRERLEGQLILPEEQREIENQIEFVRHAVREFARNYDKAEYKVLYPEVSGCVDIPNTQHHCWFVHRLLHRDVPLRECNDSCCVINHKLRFRTDAIIELYHKIWLLEQKTTSSQNRGFFWEQWQMDFQTRGYVYGIWKVTGMQPSGFLLNAIIKKLRKPAGSPSKGYKMELDPTNVAFEREYYLVAEDDLLDWEHDFTGIANDYEEAFRDKAQNAQSFKIYKNTKSCHDWNRRCYYWELCKRHQVPLEGEFVQRRLDYVDEQYYELLGLPIPAREEEETCQSVTDADLNSTSQS